MASFRKFAIVAVVLLACARMLSAASTLMVTPAGSPDFRVEGLTEPLPALNLAFGGLSGTPAKATYDIFIYGKAGAPITSPASAIGQTFANTGASNHSVIGTPSILGAVVKIAGVILDPTSAIGATLTTETLTVTGIRIDANAIDVNNAVNFTVVVIPTAGQPNDPSYGAQTMDVTVGVVKQSLKVTTSVPTAIKDTVTSSLWGQSTSKIKPAQVAPADAGFTGGGAADGILFKVYYTPQYNGALAVMTPEANLRFTFTLSNLPTGLALWTGQSITIGGASATLVSGADANGAGGALADPSNAWYRVNAVGATSGQVTYQLSDGGIADQSLVPIPLYTSKDTASLGLTSLAAPVTLVGGYAPLSTDIAPDEYADAGLLRFAAASTASISGFLVTTAPSTSSSLPYFVSPAWYSGFRAEGLTELVPDLNLAFNGLTSGPATYDIFIYGKAGAPITSPVDRVNWYTTPASVQFGITASNLGSAVKLAHVVLSPDESGSVTLTVSRILIDANAIGVNNAVSFTVLAIPTAGVVQDPLYGALSQDVIVGVVNKSVAITTSVPTDTPIKASVTSATWGQPTSKIDATRSDPGKAGFNAGVLFSVKYTPQYNGAFANMSEDASNLRFTFALANLPSGLALWTPTHIESLAGILTLVSGADVNGAGGSLADGSSAYYRVNAKSAGRRRVSSMVFRLYAVDRLECALPT
jgi:hypothetical protein